MKKLIEQSIKNSPEEYDKIFLGRSKKEPHWQDIRRWEELIKYFEGGYIVDIGCLDSKIWDMIHGKFWKKQNYLYLGTDVAKEAMKEMSKNYPYANSKGEPFCSFLVDDIYNSRIRDGIVDYVVMGEVLEHLEKPIDAVIQAFRILKPDGVLAISVPLEESKEPGAVDKDRHLWSFAKQDIEEIVRLHCSKVKFKVLRSKWWPKYQYCWPQLICFAWKKKD